MTDSAIDNELSHYFHLLNEVQKKSLLDLIKTFLHNPEYTSLQEYNNELAEAEAEYEKGETITHVQMKKQINEWKENSMK